MGAYLDIAEEMLELHGRPMTAKAILTAAYMKEVVPYHLYGKTQHKTLNARLSEDILRNNQNSKFYRTNPGVYFLSKYRTGEQDEPSIYTQFHAKRRIRELTPKSSVLLSISKLQQIQDASPRDLEKFLKTATYNEDYVIREFGDAGVDGFFPLVVFVVVRREERFLTYCQGRYRVEKDELAGKKTVGFSSLVSENKIDLLGKDALGVFNTAIETLSLDLALESSFFESSEFHTEICQITESDFMDYPAVISTVLLDCPQWFEPTQRRLSINNLKWKDFSIPLNDIDAFDDTSKALIESGFFSSIQNKRMVRQTGEQQY